MLLSKEDLIKMFHHAGFKTCEIPEFGTVVRMSASDAFDFSAITGANYLFNRIGFTIKGRNETFIHRSVFQENSYIYSPGLFERDENLILKEGNSSEKLLSLCPDVFSGDKFIYIENIKTDGSSNIDFDVYDKLKKSGVGTISMILYKLFKSGQSQESLYEYFTSLKFINSGYIVENQTPWFQQNYSYKGKRLNGGIPDFSAFKSDIIIELRNNGLVEIDKGVLINKIPVLKNFVKKKKVKSVSKHIDYELIIGEVKSDRSSLDQAVRQMKKYDDVDLANKIYSIIPNCSNNGEDEFGEIYFDNNQIIIKEAGKILLTNKPIQQIDKNWIDTNIKINLMANLNHQFLENILCNKYSISKNELRSYHLVDFAFNTNITEIIKDI